MVLSVSRLAKMSAGGDRRPFKLEMRNLTCNFLPPLVKRYNCSTHKLNDSLYNLRIMFELSRAMSNNTDVFIQMEFKPTRGVKNIKLVDVKFKVCQILGQVRRVPMVMKFVDSMMERSNLPLKCPIKGNFMYNVTNIMLSDTNFPTYMPSSTFDVNVTFFEKKDLLAYFTFGGDIIRRA
ncbi:uncharacterized protein isoform X2 [Musca autumnalis]|uniref:uncharacterized protein isoform X2 n=1 Tax=Musca autumnalis TaxID=221902 RepID=UPI003CF75F77